MTHTHNYNIITQSHLCIRNVGLDNLFVVVETFFLAMNMNDMILFPSRWEKFCLRQIALVWKWKQKQTLKNKKGQLTNQFQDNRQLYQVIQYYHNYLFIF